MLPGTQKKMPAPLGETALRRSVLFLSLPQGGGTGPGTWSLRAAVAVWVEEDGKSRYVG